MAKNIKYLNRIILCRGGKEMKITHGREVMKISHDVEEMKITHHSDDVMIVEDLTRVKNQIPF